MKSSFFKYEKSKQENRSRVQHTTLLLFFCFRYLFNCGEGTQRLAHEHKMRLAKLDSIFITQPVWENLGGLPGLALTIQDVGVPQVTLHGPEGLVS